MNKIQKINSTLFLGQDIVIVRRAGVKLILVIKSPKVMHMYPLQKEGDSRRRRRGDEEVGRG